MRTAGTAWSSLRSQERGALRLQEHFLWPQQSCLSKSAYNMAKSRDGAETLGQRQIQKGSNNFGVTAFTTTQKTKPWSLAASSDLLRAPSITPS